MILAPLRVYLSEIRLLRDAPVAKQSGLPTSDARSFRIAKVARGRAQKLSIPFKPLSCGGEGSAASEELSPEGDSPPRLA